MRCRLLPPTFPRRLRVPSDLHLVYRLGVQPPRSVAGPAEFDEVAAELGRTLGFFKVPEPEKEEVLAAFAAHKDEVTQGYSQ